MLHPFRRLVKTPALKKRVSGREGSTRKLWRVDCMPMVDNYASARSGSTRSTGEQQGKRVSHRGELNGIRSESD